MVLWSCRRCCSRGTVSRQVPVEFAAASAAVVEWSLLVVLGILFWSIIEYFGHGVMAHYYSGLVWRAHTKHHRHAHVVLTGPVWIPAAVLLALSMFVSLGVVQGSAITAGILVGFFCYEHAHWCIHFRPPESERERRLRAHHLAHHVGNPRRAIGVTTSFWDRLLGTMPSEEALAISVRMPALVCPFGFWRCFWRASLRVA